jgi:hypothetical protein
VTFPTDERRASWSAVGLGSKTDEIRAKLTDGGGIQRRVIERCPRETLTAGVSAACGGRGQAKSFPSSVMPPVVGLDELLAGFRRGCCESRDARQGPAATVNPAAERRCGQVWRRSTRRTGPLTLARIGAARSGKTKFSTPARNRKESVGTITSQRKKQGNGLRSAARLVALAKLRPPPSTVLCTPASRRWPPIVSRSCLLRGPSKTQGDEDKLGQGLHRVAEDDPTLHVQRNDETHELIITGVGDVQIDAAMERMKARSKVEVTLSTPKVAYKETVTAKGEGHYKHKKQSGGRGQYGEVYLRIEPMKPGVEHWFVDGIVGTSIPRNFLPAIEKGLVEGMQRGAVAGYPVVNTMVTVYEAAPRRGQLDIAFKIARARFKDGMSKATPVLWSHLNSVRFRRVHGD